MSSKRRRFVLSIGSRHMMVLAMLAMGTGAISIVHDAAAQPAPPADASKQAAGPSEEDKNRAREAVRQGDALAEKGEHKKALEQYQLADGIMGVPFTRMRVAWGHAKLGQMIKARQHAQSIADMPIRQDEPPAFLKARGEAQKLVKEANAKIAVITFTVAPASAAVSEAMLDGQPLAPAALQKPLEMDPGKHVLSLKASGHQPLEHPMEVKEGQRATVQLQLQAMVPKPGPEKLKPVEPIPGDSGGLAAVSPVAWIGFGVAGAGLIAGAVTGGLALGRRGELEDACPEGQCPPEQHDALDSGMLLGHISTAGFALAGAGVALGLVGLLVLSPSEEEGAAQGAVSLTPYVSPTSIGLRGSF